MPGLISESGPVYTLAGSGGTYFGTAFSHSQYGKDGAALSGVIPKTVGSYPQKCDTLGTVQPEFPNAVFGSGCWTRAAAVDHSNAIRSASLKSLTTNNGQAVCQSINAALSFPVCGVRDPSKLMSSPGPKQER